MTNVLDIYAATSDDQVGFFKIKDGPENRRWAFGFPTKSCELWFWRDMLDIEALFFEVFQTSGPTFDYITLAEGEYSESSLEIITDLFPKIPMSLSARVNLPVRFLFSQ